MSKSTKRPVDIAGSHQIPFNDAGELTELAILPATDRDTARDVEDAAAVAPVKYTSAPGGDEKATVMAGHTTSSSRGEKEDDRLRSPAEDDSERLAIRAIPRRYQLLAFSMIIFFNTSSSFSESTLSPLKGVFRDNLGVTNAQYGAISSASSLANTILPVLGGIGIDYWGATYAAIICSSFIMIGAIISAAGANTMAFSMVIGGRVLMGFGSMLIESAQLKLYAHWFQGSHLALVIGIDLAWSRVLSVVSRASAVPMSMIGGWWGWGLWIPAFVTVINLIICIMYWAFERRVPAQYRPPLGKEAREGEGKLRRRIDIATLHKLPAFFWLFCGIQIFQTSCVGVYSSNLADIQTQTRGTSQLAAGYNSSLQSVVPIILIPLTGAFFDRFGYRMLFISWTAALYVVCFGLLGLTKVHPLVPILIGSFALSTYAIPFSASIPIIVGDPALLGTAIGVWKAFGNGGIIVFDVAAGAIQDRSYNGLNYDNVIRLLMCYKSFQIVLGIFFFWLDGRWLGYSLRMSERKRLALRETVLRTGVQLRGWKRSKVGMCIVMAELVGLTVAAWTVYVVYALGK